MQDYSNVEVISLDEPQSKDRKETSNVLSIKKDSEKSYTLSIKGGKVKSGIIEYFCGLF